MNDMQYKSWSGLKKQLEETVCVSLRGRITYFLTRYHAVHNAYGRAAIRVDGTEWCCFSWVEMCRQDRDLGEYYQKTHLPNDESGELQRQWYENATLSDLDFLRAATAFLQTDIGSALQHENPLIHVFAIVDSRVGKRTLQKIREDGSYQLLPAWVVRFYELRFADADLR